MSTFTMSLKNKYFDLISRGLKTYELRLYDDKRKNVRPGDKIEFFTATTRSRRDSITVTVQEVIRGKSFRELFEKIPVKECGFSTVDEAVRIMQTIYSLESQGKIGVVAFKIQKDE